MPLIVLYSLIEMFKNQTKSGLFITLAVSGSLKDQPTVFDS